MYSSLFSVISLKFYFNILSSDMRSCKNYLRNMIDSPDPCVLWLVQIILYMETWLEMRGEIDLSGQTVGFPNNLNHGSHYTCYKDISHWTIQCYNSSKIWASIIEIYVLSRSASEKNLTYRIIKRLQKLIWTIIEIWLSRTFGKVFWSIALMCSLQFLGWNQCPGWLLQFEQLICQH